MRFNSPSPREAPEDLDGDFFFALQDCFVSTHHHPKRQRKGSQVWEHATTQSFQLTVTQRHRKKQFDTILRMKGKFQLTVTSKRYRKAPTMKIVIERREVSTHRHLERHRKGAERGCG